MNHEARVAYLVSQYPAPSHAFIAREIATLRGLGVDVHAFSVRPTDPAELLDASMEQESAATTVIQDDLRSAMNDVWTTIRRHPAALGKTLSRAARTGQFGFRSRLWQSFYLAEAIRVWEEMRRRGLRHVHAHFANNGADIARLVVALGAAADGPTSGWRWSFTMHGPTEFEAVDRYDLAAKVRDADGVACISDFARSQLMRMVEPEHWNKLRVVRMSVETDRYTPSNRARTHDQPVRLLSVGRLVPEKGWPILVHALAELVNRGAHVDLTIVGAGPLDDQIRRQIAEGNLTNRVRLLGAVGQDALPDVYRDADIFCLPSFQEGLPVVLMEAMASGLPVVTTAIAGIPELVRDRVTGRLVTPGRPDALAAALAELVADRALRARLSEAARREVCSNYDAAVTGAAQRAFLLGLESR